ncbi:MAG: hypothetical protein NVSMB62_22800 [Acidobacteriaceae bacterium]
MGWTLHRQHVRCASILRPGARRAPITGASNKTDLFGCRNVPHFTTPAEWAVELCAYVTVLALARSLWIDRARRKRREYEG